MASVARRANPLISKLPHILTWPKFGFRTICSGRLGFAPYTSTSSSPAPADSVIPFTGTKVLETFVEEFEIGSRQVTLETGKRARYANGSVVLGIGETKVLSTVCSSRSDGVRDFLPLTVDYEEKQFAQCVIPNTYMRREGAPKERELLCGRLIDRPIRPLFPPGFYHEVQVLASVLSSDGNQDPDVMAANATSAALMLSDIPWNGPIGVIRIGRICGQFIVNPSMDELSLSDLNLVYACTRDKSLMMDVQACEISEKDLEAALRLAHPEAVKYLDPQIRLAKKAGKNKGEYSLYLVPEKTKEKIRNLSEAPIEAVFSDPTYGKFGRGKALDKITQDVKKELEEECDEEGLKVLSKTIDTVRKEVIRRRIMSEGVRVDGRLLDEVRPIYCEAGDLPALHGSSLFSRGDTQVSCTVTIGAPEDAQRLDSLVGPSTKRFMLHYSFPPFCTNEVGKRVGLNRREVGHGTLAEKALLAMLPEDTIPHTVRVNSVVMASDGSTSMATVCGGIVPDPEHFPLYRAHSYLSACNSGFSSHFDSLALMDAGIPLREHVAGLSVGLVSKTDPSTGEIRDYRILTDILGLEDHVGDMDFKIAGTRNGVTAIQLDIKPAGIPLDIICESLEPARKGRLQILAHMEREINAPRTADDRNSPRFATLKYSNDAIRRLVGPLGVLKRKLEEETGARISVGDGTLYVHAKNQAAMEKVQEKIELTVGREIEVGGIYKGVVTSVKEYGAFVEFNGCQQGLLHISELSHEPVTRVSDVVSVGQKLSLMCIGQDVRGNIKLSIKATVPRPGSKVDNVIRVSEAPIKQAANIWATSSEEERIEQEKQESPLEDVTSENQTSSENQSDGAVSTSPAILIRSAAECDESEDKPMTSLKSSNCASKNAKKYKKKEKSSINSVNREEGVDSTCLQKKVNELDAENEAPMSTRTLKIGMELTAKVHQVRARGLVLDLGGGFRGMFRFETGVKTDFVVGEELRVKCLSFSVKGIPVFSLAECSG